MSLAAELDPAAQGTGAVDLLLPREKRWIGYNTLRLAAIGTLFGPALAVWMFPAALTAVLAKWNAVPFYHNT